MSAWTCRRLTARPTKRSFRLVLESHDGRALVPIPERSTSPRATSTLQRWMVCKRLTPTGRLEKQTSADARAYRYCSPASALWLGWNNRRSCPISRKNLHEQYTERRVRFVRCGMCEVSSFKEIFASFINRGPPSLSEGDLAGNYVPDPGDRKSVV